MWCMEVFHVVRAFHILDNVPTASGAKSFDGKYFILFHFGNIIGFDNGYGFTSVDLVGSNGVTVQIAYAL